MPSSGAVKNNEVLVSLAEIVFSFDAFGRAAVAKVIDFFNLNSRVYEVIFLEQRPDRIIERFILVEIDDDSDHVGDRIERASRDRREICASMAGDGKAREMTRRQIIDHGHERQYRQ